MRRTLFLALSVAAAGALAQQPPPPKLEPLPEPPPPPLIREGGRVVMLKITPPNGIPYYLMDLTGSGNFVRRDSLDPGIRVPMWTIMTFD